MTVDLIVYVDHNTIPEHIEHARNCFNVENVDIRERYSDLIEPTLNIIGHLADVVSLALAAPYVSSFVKYLYPKINEYWTKRLGQGDKTGKTTCVMNAEGFTWEIEFNAGYELNEFKRAVIVEEIDLSGLHEDTCRISVNLTTQTIICFDDTGLEVERLPWPNGIKTL